MFTVTKYPHGTFCWADCNSTDMDKARAFYTAVMGWTSYDLPMGNGQVYTMFQCEGHDIAGLGPQQDQMPSVWNSYIAVDDVDALTNKVPLLGGQVIAEPFEVFENGRMAVIQDPSGAFVSLWQARNHIGSGLVNTAGAIAWNELATREPQKAEDFFTALLGWTFQPGPMPGYRLCFVNGRVNGAIMPMDENWGDMPPHWLIYFSVKDIHDVAQKVPANGGTLDTEIMNAESTGSFVIVSDPTGAVSAMMQITNPDPWIEAES
jgi:predicted enzyme related to lactoylglutathione lyase